MGTGTIPTDTVMVKRIAMPEQLSGIYDGAKNTKFGYNKEGELVALKDGGPEKSRQANIWDLNKVKSLQTTLFYNKTGERMTTMSNGDQIYENNKGTVIIFDKNGKSK